MTGSVAPLAMANRDSVRLNPIAVIVAGGAGVNVKTFSDSPAVGRHTRTMPSGSSVAVASNAPAASKISATSGAG